MIAITIRKDAQCRNPILLRRPRYPSWSRPERTIGGAPAGAPRTSLSATAVTRAANSHRSNGRRMYRRASSSAPANIQTAGPSAMARIRLCKIRSVTHIFSLPLCGRAIAYKNFRRLCCFQFSPLSRPQGWERVPEGRVRALYLSRNTRRKSQQISRKSPHPAFGHLLPLLRNGRRGVTESLPFPRRVMTPIRLAPLATFPAKGKDTHRSSFNHA
jgi:hypothetical protein